MSTVPKFNVFVQNFKDGEEMQFFTHKFPYDSVKWSESELLFKLTDDERAELKQQLSKMAGVHWKIYDVDVQPHRMMDRERFSSFSQEAQRFCTPDKTLTIQKQFYRFPVQFTDQAFCNSLAFLINQLQIHTLDLSNNGISSLKQLFCATALYQTCLKVLVLDNNKIPFGPFILHPLFKSLTTMSLRGNPCASSPEYLQSVQNLSLQHQQTSFIPSRHMFEKSSNSQNPALIGQKVAELSKLGFARQDFRFSAIYCCHECLFQKGATQPKTQIELFFQKQSLLVQPDEISKVLKQKLNQNELAIEQIVVADQIVDNLMNPGQRTVGISLMMFGKVGQKKMRRMVDVTAQISMVQLQFTNGASNVQFWVSRDVLLVE